MSKPKLGRLLIVDDEVELMAALREALADQGYEVVGVTSGKEAFCAGADLTMLETSIHTFAEMARARARG